LRISNINAIWIVWDWDSRIPILWRGPSLALMQLIGSFRFDYEYDYDYEIRQAKRMLYAYAIPHWREKVVAVAHLSTKLWRNLVVLTTTFQKNKESWLFLFSKNNL
jgi:hypothetical protein